MRQRDGSELISFGRWTDSNKKPSLYSWSKSGTAKEQKGEFAAAEGFQVCKLTYIASMERYGKYSIEPKFHSGPDRKIQGYDHRLNSGSGGKHDKSSIRLDKIELSTIPIDKDLAYRKQHQCDIDAKTISTFVLPRPTQPQPATTHVSYQPPGESYQSLICNGALGVHRGSYEKHTRVTFLRAYGFSWVFSEGTRVTSMQDVSGMAGQIVEAIAPNQRVTVSINCQ